MPNVNVYWLTQCQCRLLNNLQCVLCIIDSLKKMEFMENLIMVSEKAANIARAVRGEEHLLSLLVQEKKDSEKNPRFDRDFKTLADVLVQEVIKHELGKKFPELIGHIHGEESNEFLLQSGESLQLQVGATKDDTKWLLNKVLCDEIAAEVLALTVHTEISLNHLPETLVLPENVPDIPLQDIAIWIDPIDSTGEYISAENKKCDGIYIAGLPCVTVLIGAFLRDSGVPVAGVINQPFCHNNIEKVPFGNIVWGVSYEGSTISSLRATSPSPKVAVISVSESDSIKTCLMDAGLNILEAAGAGYKLLCVIEGTAGAYVLSKGTTFFWDTCSCDAILRSLGGGILDYDKVTRGADIEDAKLVYSDHGNLCNSGGLIAYVDKAMCDVIRRSLRENI